MRLGRTTIVIASEAKQSRSRQAPYDPGSPRRFAPRDDDSIRTQRALVDRWSRGYRAQVPIAVDRRHLCAQSDACSPERRLQCCLMFPLLTLVHSGEETQRLGKPWRLRLDAPSKI